jgi:hypothetical protein
MNIEEILKELEEQATRRMLRACSDLAFKADVIWESGYRF